MLGKEWKGVERSWAVHVSLKIFVGALHRNDNSLSELLICMPCAFSQCYTRSGNTSAWNSGFLYALCHPTVLFPALLLHFINFPVISASPFSVF